MSIRDNVAGVPLDCNIDSDDSDDSVDSVDMNDAGRKHNNNKQRRRINNNNSNDGNEGNKGNDEKKEWNYTNKSVREALDANRKLKIKILSELERISRRKRDNRLEAARCIERSCAVILGGETKTKAKTTTIQSSTATKTPIAAAIKTTTAASKKKITTKKRKKNNNNRDGNNDDDDIIDFIDRFPTSREVSSLFDNRSNEEEGEEGKGGDNDENKDEEKKDDDHDIEDKDEKRRKKTNTKKTKAYTKQSNSNKGIWSQHIRKKFCYDPYRKWDLDYFVDPTGSRPKENDDMIRRQAFMMKNNKVLVVNNDNDNDNATSQTTTAVATTNEINPDITVCTNNPTDTVTNQQQQQQQQQERIPDTFFYHTSHSFTCQETARLDKWLLQKSSTSASASSNNNNNNKNDEDTGENNSNTNFDGSDDDDDEHDESSNSYYENIAQKLREEHHESPAARKRDKSLLPTAAPRTAEDVRMYHRHHLSSRYKFSKRESLIILEGVAGTEKAATTAASTTATGKLSASIREEEDQQSDFGNIDDDDGDGDNYDKKKPLKLDWELICNRVLEEHHRVESTKNPSQKKKTNDDTPYVSPITPYQCMVHYKTKLRPQPDGSFTSEEDELLLRYVAAMGPQFMWGYPQIADLASRIFPYKASRRIYERTHWSQWHPLSKDTMWMKEEEMKLVLAMKIYSDSGENGTSSIGGNDTEDEQTNQKRAVSLEKAAIRRAAAHFHPSRQPYKVSKKWERSFSPRFSYRPFSKEEDSKLLEVVRSLAATTHFSEIARKNFPDRSTDQISQRWNKIAPDKDIVEKLVPSMVHSGVRRGLVARMTTTGLDAPNGSENMDNNNTVKYGAIFDPSDFVVELAPKDNEGKIQDLKNGCNTKSDS
jgi:hypothetical protein